MLQMHAAIGAYWQQVCGTCCTHALLLLLQCGRMCRGVCPLATLCLWDGCVSMLVMFAPGHCVLHKSLHATAAATDASYRLGWLAE